MTRTKIAFSFVLIVLVVIFVAQGARAFAASAVPANIPSVAIAPDVHPNAQGCNGTPYIQYAYANPPTIYPGQITTLYWGLVGNAQAAYLEYPGGHRAGIGTPGSQQVNPTQTTTYYIVGVCGANEAKTPITVNVQGGPTCSGTPVLNGFSANPTTINNGQASLLSWGAVGNADYVQLSSQFDGGSGVPTPGQTQVQPNQTTTYYLTAWCQGNTAQAQVTITVNYPQPPTPTPPPPNPNQLREIQVEKSSKGEFKVMVNYYWNGEDAPASIQSMGYNSSNQPITNRASTNIIAGFVKYVIQQLQSVGGQGAVTAVNSCIVGSSGTELACLSVPVK
ncbi:MAG: hypothetical protein HY741_06465 [Chloroflexi bacterium]|nr:hypothetical protein [Chloroflexota bacterium]